MHGIKLRNSETETIAVAVLGKDYPSVLERTQTHPTSKKKLAMLISDAHMHSGYFHSEPVRIFVWSNFYDWAASGGKQLLDCMPDSFGFARISKDGEDSVSVGGDFFKGFFFVRRVIDWRKT